MPDSTTAPPATPFASRWLAPIELTAARYGAALAGFGLITALQRLVQPWLTAVPFMGAFAAVSFAAWFCGPGPGALLTALGAASAAYFFIHPSSELIISSSQEAFSLVAFSLISSFMIVVGHIARSSFLRLRALSDELRVGEERWRSLAEAIPQIVWSADAQGKIDYQNERWLELTGHTIDEARRLGWPMTVHPDDVQLVMARWQAAVQAGSIYEVESRLKRVSDGTWRWHLSRGVPVRDSQGRVVKWFGTSTDIDDQKNAAERARFLSAAGEILASSLDYEATLQHVARAAVPQFADWASVDLVGPDGAIQRVAVAHIDPRKVQYAHELHRKYPPNPNDPVGVPNVLRTGKAELMPEISDAMLAQIIPDPELLRIARELQLRSAITAPIVARGKTLGAISFVMAESGRTYSDAGLQIAEELGRRAGIALDNARLYRDAQAASRLKDEFLSTISHELRTPLTAIVGWAHLLALKPEPEKLERGAKIIERNARAQAQLIDDLLDVSRIVTGKMRLHVRSFSPFTVVQAAMESVRPTADARGLRLTSVLDPAAGPLLGDPDRLQQILWNLLSNAAKFTPKGGRIQVRLARVDSHIELEVSDTGAGIDPQFLPRIFDRFTQADASVSRTHGGLGLGMSIARHLTELHGGTIEAHSEGVGKGATFLVKLPLSPARAASEVVEEHPAITVPERTGKPLAQSLRGLSVLVVEDSLDARELLREVLERAGATVAAAASVEEARRQLASGAPDLLVSDIGMPGEDGYALIRSVRQQGLRLPAIALTAYARSEDRTRALVEGFDFHLAKPVDPDELVVVAGALRNRKN